jgi:HSP20 family protein
MFNLTPSRRGERAMTTHRGHPLDLLRHEFESMFERMFGRWPALTEMSDEMEAMRFWDLSTTENEAEFVVKAEVPGFDANELNVQLNENLLTIEAEKRKESGKEKEFSRFRRSVTLPSGIDAEKAQASYRNGVLDLLALLHRGMV